MILTDREIQTYLQRGRIKISPEPKIDQYSSTTVDLTLSPHLRKWHIPDGTVIRPGQAGYKYVDIRDKYTERLATSGGYIFRPREFILAMTAEELDLRNEPRVAARVEGKSSLARLGIGIHVTAPTIQAGFAGQIQLELCNHGIADVELLPGMPICQLIFELTFGTPNKEYDGQFQGQKGN